MSCTEIAHAATMLRACYAMSGTEIAHGATMLRACYAMSGTEIAHAATMLRACYAMSGTEIAHAATRTGVSCASPYCPRSLEGLRLQSQRPFATAQSHRCVRTARSNAFVRIPRLRFGATYYASTESEYGAIRQLRP
eukprot:3936491-Rhodomonas_salina.1